MPSHVAHDVVHATLATAQDVIKSAKSSPGVIKWTVETLEGPVCTVLRSKPGQTAVKVGDGALTYADGTLDRAMSTNAYKATSRVVKTTYSNRVVPATTAVKKGLSAVSRPVTNAYSGALELADKSVEWALPEADSKLAKEDKALPKSVVGISRKISRRSVRKVAATRKMVAAAAAYTIENAKPAKMKANTVIVYQKSLVGADKLVDKYLPEKDGLKGSTAVLLVKKMAKRGKTHAIATIKKIATAIKNSPATFKKSAAVAYKRVTEQALKLKNMKLKLKLVTVQDVKQTLAPYIKSTDAMLLNYRYTAAVRNLVVSKLGPIVQPLITKVLGKEEKPSIMPSFMKPAATRSAPPATRAAPPTPLVEAQPQVEAKEAKDDDAPEAKEESDDEAQAAEEM